MPAQERLERRLRAVERALTGDDHDLDALARSGDFARRLDEVEDRLDDMEEQIDELDAATQAVRGYVGNVRSVNEDVAQRADAALAAVDRLEDRLDADESSRRRVPDSADRAQRASGRAQQPSPTGNERVTGESDRRQHDLGQAATEERPVDGRTGDGQADDARARKTVPEGDHDTDRSDADGESVLGRIRARL